MRLLGADGLTSTARDYPSELAYGYWPITKSYPSISVQATLDDRALSLLRPTPIKTVTMTPESNAPKPWDDFYLGDTVSLYANRGSIQESTPVRVNAFTVLVDDNGIESSEIPTRRPRKRRTRFGRTSRSRSSPHERLQPPCRRR